MVILILSAVANILFSILLYKDLIKLFSITHAGMKALVLILSLGLCIPFIVALHKLTLFFLIHHLAYLWLLIMILLCIVLTVGLFKGKPAGKHAAIK